MLAGVWFGPKRPPPDIILASAHEKFHYLHTVGLDINTAEGNKHA